MSPPPRDTLYFPSDHRPFLEPHLPPPDLPPPTPTSLPFTTLTFATSLDSQLSLSPGVPTALSGPQSKAMTHYLRLRHDAILIGVGTAVADNPSLNCRISGAGGYGGEGLKGQPRPVVLDPRGRWDFGARSKVLELAGSGRGRAPYILTGTEPEKEKREILEGAGGKFIRIRVTRVGDGENKVEWKNVLRVLSEEGLRSVMIEGGGAVINSLLQAENLPLVNSVIVTIAPMWLGVGGVVVSPPRCHDDGGNPMAAARLHHVQWHPFGEDVVMCGKLIP